METVVFKWDHKILGGVPLATLVELVFYGKPGWVYNAANIKGE